MGSEFSKPHVTILAVVTLPQHQINSGNAMLVQAKDENEQKKLTAEIAKAVKGDVTLLSNGIYLILV